MEVRVFTTSSLAREENEDCAMVITKSNTVVAKDEHESSFSVNLIDGKLMAVVADGLGGYRLGKTASEYVVEEIRKRYSHMEIIPLLYSINKEMMGFDCGLTTLSILKIDTDNVCVLNSGDSRVYAYDINKEEICQLSRDDSTIPLLMKCFGLSQVEAARHPKAALTNCVGQRHCLIREIHLNNVQVFSMFILMSDGAYLALEEKWDKLTSIVKDGKADETMDLIKKEIVEKAEDNATVVLIKVRDELHG